MKAAAFKRQNEMGIVEVAKPKAAPGEVVLKVHDCGICGSDLHACQYGFGMPADSIMGHEFCGEVHEIGAGVRGFEPGQRVAGLPFVSCGTCDRCKRGMQIHCHNLKGLGLGQLPGAYAEFVSCAATSLFKLPDNVSSRDGALVEPLSVGLHAVKRSGVGPGATAIIMGAGPIGLATLTWAKGKGATVVVSELAEGRAELARKLGADVVVNPNSQSPVDKVREMTERNPELVFECIGVKGTLEQAINMVGPRSQVVVVGVCMEPDQIQPIQCIMKEVSVNFVLGYDPVDFDDTIDALATGKIKPQPMVTDIITVDQVPEMFTALRRPGSRAKVLVEFPH
ncbi:MAG TPA: alcohol dehydrogenase catalytic domain-containing protein [Candidatus Binataceae bacterium]|nr:alcohol dehydrogenase catalytic domain-containing protein [Candidatus Binataceae bacterium]